MILKVVSGNAQARGGCKRVIQKIWELISRLTENYYKRKIKIIYEANFFK